MFTNKYTEPDPTSTQLEVKKLYQTADGQSVNFGENVFKFKIEAEDNAPLPAVKEISTSGSDISVSYTHLDVYKRQLRYC